MNSMIRWKVLLFVGLAVLCLQGVALMGPLSPAADEPTPEQVIAAAAVYLRNLPQFGFYADITEDMAWENGAMVQSAHQMKYVAKRPDKIRFKVVGDARNSEWFYNGKTITAFNADRQLYSREAFPPTIDAALARARDEFNLRMSIAGMARTDLYEMLTENIAKSSLVGLSRVNGQTCYQLLLEREQVNVQLWIQTGEIPLFRKMLISYKTEPGAPQWTAVFTQWDTSPDLRDSLFEFVPPQGTRQIKFLRATMPSDS